MPTDRCTFCRDSEPSIAKITNQTFPIGEACYARLLENNATWQPDTPMAEIQEMLVTKQTIASAEITQVSTET